MRFLKKLLTGIYIFIAAFVAAVFIAWVFIREEPAALLTFVGSVCGVEIILSAIIKFYEAKNKEKEGNNYDNDRNNECGNNNNSDNIDSSGDSTY